MFAVSFPFSVFLFLRNDCCEQRWILDTRPLNPEVQINQSCLFAWSYFLGNQHIQRWSYLYCLLTPFSSCGKIWFAGQEMSSPVHHLASFYWICLWATWHDMLNGNSFSILLEFLWLTAAGRICVEPYTCAAPASHLQHMLLGPADCNCW